MWINRDKRFVFGRYKRDNRNIFIDYIDIRIII